MSFLDDISLYIDTSSKTSCYTFIQFLQFLPYHKSSLEILDLYNHRILRLVPFNLG